MKTSKASESTVVRIAFSILGPPRTKKNHGWRTKQGHQMPSKAFEKWNASAQLQMARLRSYGVFDGWSSHCTVNCTATFYRDREIGDAVGYYQALADALQDARVVDDDVLIQSWDGSRLKAGGGRPRIEVVLQIEEFPV